MSSKEDVVIDLHCPKFKSFKEAWSRKDTEWLDEFFVKESLSTVMSCISMLVKDAKEDQNHIAIGLCHLEANKGTSAKDLIPILERQFKLLK